MDLNFDIVKSSLESASLSDCDIHRWDSCNFKVTKKDQKSLTAESYLTLNVTMMVETKSPDQIDFDNTKWVSDGTLVSFRNGQAEIGGSHSMSIINLSDPNSINEIGMAIKDSLEYSEKFYQQIADEQHDESD